MASICLSIKNIMRPQVLVSEKDFLVVYKPPRMHSAPLTRSPSDNLLNWCAGKFPEIADLPGRRTGEGGLLHRLDFETHGLLLIARNLRGMEVFIDQQKAGIIIKEYCALTSEAITTLPGFPKENPGIPPDLIHDKEPVKNSMPVSIKSAFRSYGFGRKAVRPVIAEDENGTSANKKDIVFDNGKPYVTDILETHSLSHGITFFRLRIFRGFRHQIRSHLAWLNRPVLNDDIYGNAMNRDASFGKSLLGLRAYSISFIDPSSKIKRAYSVPSLELDEI